ncbi:spermatogenesis-associated protein 48 [Lingula anatina]|uniref:Spermatogenesis-associated protein 48 n=1 Tax=Lingula anatina TaxID=7574 RepID=A0A1S3IEY5_LINAN|nr:spermatogenesis-associated protein 48 [Lingula anatina]|eukprot:XP_013396416.1 spermatogenesis-associated protein 48 [Lingula anatina]
MTQVIAPMTVLSDSTFRTRPHFNTYLYSDANAGPNSVRQIEERRKIRQTKFPSVVGRNDVDSFKELPHMGASGFKKWNDEGDHRPEAPFRLFDNIVDPVSGFVSVGGDVDRTTGRHKIPQLGGLELTPQTMVPQFVNSVRANCPTAPLETRRLTQSDPGPPSAWNSRKLIDDSIKSHLGGWTSNRDTRENADGKVEGTISQWMNYSCFRPEKNLRDKLALKYMFTSSTERGYGDVPWDTILPPKQNAATKTHEERPDMISQKWTIKRYDPAAEEWQAVGRSWDWFQTRKSQWYHGPNGVVFCSPCPRQQQIPLYGGCIGGENLDEIDNRQVPFQPMTVKRNPQPWVSETAHRPNIPKYDGCTLYERIREPAHSGQLPPEQQTTRRVHRYIPIPQNFSEFKRDSQLSKMVTTVPPHNPFNLVNKEQIKLNSSNGRDKGQQSPEKQNA